MKEKFWAILPKRSDSVKRVVAVRVAGTEFSLLVDSSDEEGDRRRDSPSILTRVRN